MKKKLFTIFFLGIFLLPAFIFAKENPLEISLFYGRDCSASHAMIGFLVEIADKYPQIERRSYEVTYNSDNRAYFEEICRKYKIDSSKIPVLIIGDHYVVGFKDKATTGKTIERYLEELIQKTAQKNKEATDRKGLVAIISFFVILIVVFALVFKKKNGKIERV